MDFRLLGPLAAVQHDRLLALGGPKQRALLAVLLLHANDVVSTERLVDELWGESPPATVAKSIQVYVSRLRKELGPGRLVTRAPGYVLQLDPSELDVACFERLVAEARRADSRTAAEKLREALALWRGSPLADLAYEAFAQPEIARLAELRLAALEERLEADLATGRHAELVGELDALIAEHPLRERLRHQQMRALYRSGRQAEALEAYRRARTLLVDELGIEPGPELQRLERAILVQDASLDAEPQGGQPRSHPGSGFVGRELELKRLDAALDDVLGGQGRLVLLAGEPGIGKSRLSEELLGRARASGAQVLVGRCWEAGGAPAYWPWVQALGACFRATDPQELRAQLGPGAADLAQLFPELRGLFPDLQQSAAPDSEGARFRLFEAAAAFLWSVADVQPLVLMLDDLHAADEPSLLLLRFVARELGHHRLLAICAFRDVDPTLGESLSATLAELVREPQTAHISLAGLSERDVAQYIALSTGAEPAPQLAAAIHAQTEGNPLFVSEVVRLLDGERRIGDADASLSIPPGVRIVIGQRIERLSEPCRSVLAAASVMGREFELEPLMGISKLPRDGLLDVLDEALAERIIGDAPGSPGRLRFGHALIRDTLYDELPSALRMRLHQLAGEALESIHVADLEPHLAELAQHFYAAAPAGPREKAIVYARRAGDRAAAQLAYEEAVRHYKLALRLVTETTARCELLLALGDAHARAGDRPASKQAYNRAAELAADGDLREHFARAALGYGGRIIWDVSRDDDNLLRLLEQALTRIGDDDSPMRVMLLARLAGGPLRDARFPPERRARLSEEALEMARRIGDPATLAYAVHGCILGHHSPDLTHSQLELATEFLQIAKQTGDRERILEAHEERLEALLELGEKRAADRELDAMAIVARELRQPSQNWFVSTMRARMALLEGRLPQAAELISQAHAIGEQTQNWNATVTYRLQLYALRREQGRLGEIEDLVRRSIQDYPTYPIFHCAAAHTAAALGNAKAARDALETLSLDDFAAIPFDEEWLVSMTLLAEAACILDDGERASALCERLLPYADRVAVAYPEISTGAVARNLGLLAATVQRVAAAEQHFEQALELNDRIGARRWLAHTQEDYARLLLTLRTTDAADKARTLLAQASATYQDLGMRGAAGFSSHPLAAAPALGDERQR